MNVDLWVTALRVLAITLTVSIVWPGLLELWRHCGQHSGAAPKRGSK